MNLNTALAQIITPITALLRNLAEQGARCYLVGGVVRDLFLSEYYPHLNINFAAGDIDIEVFGINIEILHKILDAFSPTILVGKQFGVLRMSKYQIDWSIPRKDSVGRKPKVEFCVDMSISEALARRDIRINAMAIDLNMLETVPGISNANANANTNININANAGARAGAHAMLIDPFGGLQDLQQKIIRCVSSEKFLEDPLRFFRVMQFVARFEFSVAPDLIVLAKTMRLERFNKKDSVFIAKERITAELLKMLAKSRKPSLGFCWIKSLERLDELFPELFFIAKSGLWDKFCESLDNCNSQLVIQLSCIFFWIGDAKLQKSFASSLSFNQDDVSQAMILARAANNMINFDDDFGFKMQAKTLGRCNMQQVLLLQKALGKLSQEAFFSSCEKVMFLGVFHGPVPALVTGYDFLQYFAKGPEIKIALDVAYKLQMQHPEYDKAKIIEKVLQK